MTFGIYPNQQNNIQLLWINTSWIFFVSMYDSDYQIHYKFDNDIKWNKAIHSNQS
jgi:hypothetical protein